MSVEDEYSDLEPLKTRIAIHRKYSEHPDDVEETVYTALQTRLGDSVLDVGCGTGSFLKRLRQSWEYHGELVGLDSSPAAVEQVGAEGAAEAVLGSATQLPFDPRRFDTVVARHMLYHVPRPQAALQEFARVVRPDGQVAVSVNHGSTVPRVTALVHEHMSRHGVAPVSLSDSVTSNDLPELMATVFTQVSTVSFDNALVFPDPDPLIRFAVALLGVYGLPRDSTSRSAIVAGIRDEALSWFARNSAPWRDPKGYSICIGQVLHGN